MKTRKTPQQKKHLSYTRDTIYHFNSDKGSRRSWPRKEAQIARAFRRQVAQTLHPSALDMSNDIDSAVLRIVRKKKRKCGVRPLAKAVAHDKLTRIQHHGLHQALHTWYDANGITFPSSLAKPRKPR